MRTIQLRHLEVGSPVHRVRAEAKILAVAILSSAVAFAPGWPGLAVGWAAAVIVFGLARLPAAIVAPPHRVVLLPLGVAAALSLLSGGDPVVGGVELGGLIELAQFVTLGFLLVTLAALLAWTSSLTDVALGLGRLLGPLRLVRLPVDEVATAVVLAVRALPAVRAELATVVDARRTRPPAEDGSGRRASLAADAVDLGAAVVVGAHRRAHELGRSMVARGSVTAPIPEPTPFHARDAVLVLGAAVVAGVIVLIG